MLSEEEKKTIEKLSNGEKIELISLIRVFKREGIENFVITRKEYIETVLNLVTKQQKENKEKDKQIKDLKSKKDNQEKRFKRYKENIEKQHEEIYENLVSEQEQYKYLYQKALDNTVKSDKENMDLKKQINLMAEYIARLDIDQDICIKVEDSCFDYAGQNGKTCEECLKQYFEKLAKEKGE